MALYIGLWCFYFGRFKEVAESNTPSVKSSNSSFKDVVFQTVNANKHQTTTRLSERLVMWCLIAFCESWIQYRSRLWLRSDFE